MVTVTLTESELRQAAEVGVQRYMSNLRVGGKHTQGLPEDADHWDLDIFGAIGELCVAKHLNIFWSGSVWNWRADDVGAFQVRATRRSNGHLRLLHKDNPARAFILVTGDARKFEVVGWLQAVDGKRPEYWGSKVPGRFAFWVPQNKLHPIEELMDWHHACLADSHVPA